MRCWVTGNGVVGGAVGANDVDGGVTTLRSRRYDLSGLSSPVASYWRWYSNDQGGAPNTDVFRVDVSNDDGASWVTVETVGPAGPETAGGWFRHSFRVADFVAPTHLVRLRFVAQDLGADSVVEAAVDDLVIVDADCSGTRTFCSGDGTATACPCGNLGASGAGCASATGPGARLMAAGGASLASDTIVLTASGLANGTPGLFFAGTAEDNGGLGSVFGDGLRCVGGSIVRLGTKFAGAGGTVSYPETGDAPIAAGTGITAGATRAYQTWYRSATPFCTSATFNLTNGITIGWGQ